MKRWMVLWFAILTSATVLANDAKLAPELKQLANDQMVSVIVQYKTVPSNVSKDRIRMSGGAVSRDLALVWWCCIARSCVGQERDRHGAAEQTATTVGRRCRGLYLPGPRGAKPPQQCGSRSAGELCLGLGFGRHGDRSSCD